MAVQRDTWKTSFVNWPMFLCPTCEIGQLTIEKKSIRIRETASSKAGRGHEAWDPDWIDQRFSAALSCTNPQCKEPAFVCGKVTTDWFNFYEEDGSTGTEIIEEFVPHYFEPSIPVFPIPKECPAPVASELRNSFALLWSDTGSCGNRLRVAAEMLMNELQIPKKAKITNEKKKGQLRLLSLHDRIKLFEAKNKDAAMQLMAVKWLGNAGSHTAMNALTHDDILDALEHFEYALDLIYKKTVEGLIKRAKSIARLKGSVRGRPKWRRRLRSRGRTSA